jgi:hypothetical protein
VASPNWSRRPIKAYVRDLVARVCKRGKKHALLFPADHAKDVLALQKTGVINGLTKLSLVEKSTANMTKALRAVSRSGLGNTKGRSVLPHANMLHKLTLWDHLRPAPGNPDDSREYRKALDFAWFDYCGSFSNQEATWTQRNARHFMWSGSDVLFTFQACLRGRHNGNAYFARFESGYEGKIRAEIREMGRLETMHVRDDGSIYYVPATAYTLRAVAIRRIGLRELFNTATGRSHNWTFKINHLAYKDRDPTTQDDRGPVMILLHLTDIQ